MRTPHHHESSSPLETISRMDKSPIHYTNRPCESSILEITKKPKLTNSLMACRSARIQLPTKIHTWENQHSGRHTLQTSWCWPRTRRQQRYYCLTSNMHPPYLNRTAHSPKCKGAEEGNSKQSTQCTHSWTSRKRQNTSKSPTKLLVGRHKEMGWRLCQGVHHMPTNQGPNP